MILVTIARACGGPMLEGKSGPWIKSRAGFPVHISPKLETEAREEAGFCFAAAAAEPVPIPTVWAGFCFAGGFCAGEGFDLDAAANSSAAAVSINAMLWSVVLLFLAMLRVTMMFLGLLIALMCDSFYGAWWCVESGGGDEVTLAEFRNRGEWRQCACGRANAAWPGGGNKQTEEYGEPSIGHMTDGVPYPVC